MEETIKGIEVIAYKGMNYDMTCRDFHYEIGKTYKTDSVELCKCGFHACLNPRNVRYYYPQDKGSRHFKVKLSGEIAKCDEPYTKVAATEITILEEITDTFNEVINTEWWKSENVLDLLYWSNGFARVQRGDKLYNFIDKQGNILLDDWFMWVDDFHEGFARVQRTNDELNFIDTKGNILLDEWFMWVDDFKDGFAEVQRSNGEQAKIDKSGNLIKKMQ